MRGWVLLLTLLVAAVWVLDAHWAPPTPSVGRPAQSAATATRVRSARAPITATTVLHSPDLAATLAQFSAHATVEDVQRLRAEVDAACRVLVLLQLDGRVDADVRRDQSRHELTRRCGELPVPSMYVPIADTRLPLDDASNADAAASALANLYQARSPERLVDAWLEAFRVDALPQQKIFPDQRRLLPAEAEALIQVVVDWRECTRLNACGADSLITLKVCALHGCEPGNDLRAAWHQALSPRDFEAAVAIHEWLRNQQSAGNQ